MYIPLPAFVSECVLLPVFCGVSHICYSVKANSNLSILCLLAKMGCAFDVVSGGELDECCLPTGGR